MARQKSTSGSKTPGTKKKEEVSVPASPAVATVNPPVVQAAETTVAVESAKVAERKAVEAKPFEVRRPEPRKNVVPINLEEEIRRRAYELYQMRGAGSGNEAEDWLVAEREVLQRYHQQSA